MATVDSLDIQISAQVNKANISLTTLINRLDRVSASLSGVNTRGLATMGAGINKLANAMSNFSANTKTADFSRLSRNLASISNIDTSKFSEISSKMSQLSVAFNSFGTMPEGVQQIGEFSKNISKLGNKSVQNAVTNIPQLANAIKNLMQTLSTAPVVSQNVIQMTNALANLASQGGRVGSASQTMVNGLNNASNAMNRARNSSLSLAVALGKLYIVLRGMRKLWKSIESSFDYLEVLNYFDAAFGQVAQNADLSAFEQMGYDSAEAYYQSFAKRAEELTAKMSGFTVGENGALQATGGVSLGLDPSQLMNYQAMFGQMASSMGVTSETALKLSQALTEIGADLASVKNLDFADVWNDMASSLAGMSRVADKYGVNIRNVNLQQKLTELGIEANISALNQNDKALLRTIILLDSTKYAWGDLADTISQPANQLRLIQANFQNLSRTIGNLFLPLVQKVLPYINALVIATQRLFTWLGNLIGIDLSGISTKIGSADIGGLLDQTDELAGDLGDAKKAADKLNKSLRQFDELKVISTKEDEDTGTSAIGGISGGLLDAAFEDAFSEYQKVWDEAFANLENKAQKIADKIEKAFEPIKKIIEDFTIGDFFQAGQDVSNLVVNITDFFARAIDNVDWYGIGKKIGDFLAGINWTSVFKSAFKLIGEAFKAAFEVWLGLIGSAPIEGAIITFFAADKIVKVVGSIGDAFGMFFGSIAAHPYVAIAGALATVAGVLINLSKISSDPFRNISEKTKEMINNLADALSDMENIRKTYMNFVDEADTKYGTVSILSGKYFELSQKENLSETDRMLLGEYKKELESYVGDITGYIDEITGAWTGTKEEMEALIKKSYEYYKQQAYADYLIESYKAQANVEIEIEKISLEKENTQKQIDDFYKEIEGIVGREVSRSDLVFDIESLIMSGKLDKNFLKQAQNVERLINDLGAYEISLNEATNQLNAHKDEVRIVEQAYNNFSVSTENNSISIDRNTKSIQENTGKIRENINQVILNEKTAINSNEQVRKSYKQMSSETKGEINSITERLKIWSKDNEMLGSNAGNNLNKKYTENIKNILPNSENILNNLNTTFTQAGTIIGGQTGKNISDSMAQSIEERRIELKNKLSSIFNGITAAVNLTGNQIRVSTPAYAMGGFPEDGWFRASKGEYFGRFDDGTSYIANNNQIEMGIAAGVEQAAYQGMVRAMKEIGGFGTNVKVTLDPKSESMFKIIKSESDSYINRTRRNPWTGERL